MPGRGVFSPFLPAEKSRKSSPEKLFSSIFFGHPENIGYLAGNESSAKHCIMFKSTFTCLALLLCLFCPKASAQDWKSVLGDAVKTIVGDKATTAQSLVGTWSYSSPECQFQSDNLLAKAGGQAAAVKVENELDKVYRKLGVDNCTLVLTEQGEYTFSVKGKSSGGKYVFDDQNKTLILTDKLGITLQAKVAVTGSSMTLVFNADKLFSALTTLTGLAAKVNNTAATINSLIRNYDGLMLGMELNKR